MSSILQTITNPHDLSDLSPEQLIQLADELRQFVIQSVSITGGHLSAGLGTIEITIPLHYVFNTPEDRIGWHVGHPS